MKVITSLSEIEIRNHRGHKSVEKDKEKTSYKQSDCVVPVDLFLLRKIALPYPHKSLFGFVEQKRIDRQEFFKEYSCHKR